MAKHVQTSDLLERRIRRGDYLTQELPTEAELAEEMGVSRVTARRAVGSLLRKGLVTRKPYGRLQVNQRHKDLSGRLNVAFVAPAFPSPDFVNWRYAVEHAALKLGALVRAIDFVHWDDPVLNQVLAGGFDGVFLIPCAEAIPPVLLERFGRIDHLVVLDGDLSRWGVPSVELFPANFVARLGTHLYELGHRNIDCLNTQPHDDPQIGLRQEQWQLWQRLHKAEGRLIDEPVESYSHPTPKAYSTMKRLLQTGEFSATALVCLTDAAATGAIRALHEHGLVVGRDVSVCAMEGAGLERYRCPSLTVLEQPARGPYAELCLDWFAKRTAPWLGPKLIQPAEMSLFIGESTGPAPGTTGDFTTKDTKDTKTTDGSRSRWRPNCAARSAKEIRITEMETVEV